MKNILPIIYKITLSPEPEIPITTCTTRHYEVIFLNKKGKRIQLNEFPSDFKPKLLAISFDTRLAELTSIDHTNLEFGIHCLKPEPVLVSLTLDVPQNEITKKPNFPLSQKMISFTLMQKKDHCCVCIDPGHGGHDGGAQGACEKDGKKVQEKDLTQAIANLVYDEINKIECCKPFLTKADAGTFLEPKDRPKKCEEKGCTGFFVSIHMNSVDSKDAKGTEGYYPQKDQKNEKASKASKDCAEKLAKSISETLGTTNRGAKNDRNLAVLREGSKDIPAVLIETGFISNEDECKKLINPDNQKKIAKSIAEIICKCCSEYAKTK